MSKKIDPPIFGSKIMNLLVFSILSRKSVSGSQLHGVCMGWSGTSACAVYALFSHFLPLEVGRPQHAHASTFTSTGLQRAVGCIFTVWVVITGRRDLLHKTHCSVDPLVLWNTAKLVPLNAQFCSSNATHFSSDDNHFCQLSTHKLDNPQQPSTALKKGPEQLTPPTPKKIVFSTTNDLPLAASLRQSG